MALEYEFTFPLKNGLHARPASFFQEAASAFSARITFVNRRTGASANAKSTLSLVATVTREGDPCAVCAEGEDEAAACDGMKQFLTGAFPGCDEDLVAVPAVPGSARPLPRALRGEPVHVHTGIAASKGIGRAPAVLLDRRTPEPPPGGWAKQTDDDEVARVRKALREAQSKMRTQVASTRQGAERDILKAHLSILDDPDLAGSVEGAIRLRHCSAGDALVETANRYTDILAQSGSVYLQERILDIQDVISQLLTSLYGTSSAAVRADLPGDAVCIADTLAPSVFIGLDKERVKGLVLAHGGVTSHTVILARSFGIPCVTGITDIHRAVSAGEDVVVDGERGLVVRTPSERAARFYDRERHTLQRIRARLQRSAGLPGVTADGRRLEIGANAASAEEVGAAVGNGAEGIGLFRTEILFMDRTEPPGEEEQYEVYARAAKSAGGKPVIIRTLDIGGDKPIPFLHLPPEENPFLGYRATRLYAEYPELINTQLRAILRASVSGNIKVMFPMICSLQEVRALKRRMQELMRELDTNGTPYDRQMAVGIMVEIPSIAFVIDQLCREVDFFSIGTNDLTQYFLAADRSNTKVSYLYSPFHPSFLRLLKQIIDEVHRHEKWVGLCGEMGGNPLAVPLFVAYGIDEISLASAAIPGVKEVVHRCRVPRCEELLASVLQMEDAEAVQNALKGYAASTRDDALATEELVSLSAQCATKEEAIREAIGLLHRAGRIDDPDLVEEAVWAREETYPTGMGFGVAIPHCKSPHVTVSSIAVLKLDSPIPWNPPEEDSVGFMILIAISAEAKGDQHLKIIAGLARKLMHEEFREQLMDAPSAARVVDLLRQQLNP